jgi:hypothetical protein
MAVVVLRMGEGKKAEVDGVEVVVVAVAWVRGEKPDEPRTVCVEVDDAFLRSMLRNRSGDFGGGAAAARGEVSG